MNFLSWIIYGADVVGDIGNMIAFFGITISILFVFLVCAISFTSAWSMFADYENERELYKKSSLILKKYVFSSLKALIVIAVIAAIIPSAKTLYLIAASEIGEEVLISEEGQKLRQVINERLDEIIQEEKEDSE